MVEIGKPKYKYQVPYDKTWYIIITSNNYHFYFNKFHGKSYWQLHDVFQSNQDLDKDKFLNSIDYNYVSLLIGLNGGLEELQTFYSKLSGQKNNNLVSENETNEDISNEEADPEKIDESEYEVDEGAKNKFITQLLKEEGYLVEKDDNNNDQQDNSSDEPEKIPATTGLVAGYSSDEESSEEEKEEEEEKGNVDVKPNIQNNNEEENELDQKIDYSDEDQNQGLDLSLSDDDLINNESRGYEDKETKKKNFLSLLDKFEDRISIFDTWELVEEELIQYLVKNPEYFSISEPSDRENLFNIWCKTKSESEAARNPFSFNTSEPVLYLKYLQEHKNEVKTMFYQQFLGKYFEDISPFNMPSKQKEAIYLSFKIMINDFTKFEKKTKKLKSHDPSVNLKKQKLEGFIKKHMSIFNSIKNGTIDIEAIEKLEVSHFEKWIALVNAINVPKNIVENVENFIVGDKKRLQCYIEAVNTTL